MHLQLESKLCVIAHRTLMVKLYLNMKLLPLCGGLEHLPVPVSNCSKPLMIFGSSLASLSTKFVSISSSLILVGRGAKRCSSSETRMPDLR